jgi:hypothetical protein
VPALVTSIESEARRQLARSGAGRVAPVKADSSRLDVANGNHQECEAAQQAAMANEALSRVGSTTEQLSDGIKTWDSDRQHYTTFRHLCRLPGARPAPFQ